jgi:hypothetical protein
MTFALIFRHAYYCWGCGKSSCYQCKSHGFMAGAVILDNPAFLCEYQERFGMEPVDAERETADEAMSRCIKEGYSVKRV